MSEPYSVTGIRLNMMTCMKLSDLEDYMNIDPNLGCMAGQILIDAGNEIIDVLDQ